MCIACFQYACTGAIACDAPNALAADLPPGSPSYVTDYTALLAYTGNASFRLNANAALGTQVFVTYSFTESPDIPSLADYNPYDSDGYFAFNEAQRANTRLAMEEFSRLSGVTFVEAAGQDTMLQLFNSTGSIYGGWANYPSVWQSDAARGRLVMDTDGDFARGTSGFQILLHELGHAVGLKHPFDGDTRLTSGTDTTFNTVMSYVWSGGPYSALRALDVAAVQHIYGEARANAGWTWGMVGSVFQLRAAAGDDVVLGVRTANNLGGGSGRDLLRGLGDNDTLAGGGGNDTLIAVDGDDRLNGGGGRDRLEGGWGNDVMFGGSGNDTILAGGGADRAYGEDGDDVLYGESGANRLYGGDGNDILHGGSSSETLSGDAGHDTIYGGNSGNNRISGGDGDDLIFGQLEGATFNGFDTIDGGAGNDTIHGQGGSDVIRGRDGADVIHAGAGWDDVFAGRGDDLVFGGANPDDLYGEQGRDTLHGDADNDKLYGGTGNDRLFGGDGTDWLYGGAGTDRLVGGAGGDYFFQTTEDRGSVDMILDFEVGVDRIYFQGFGWVGASRSKAASGSLDTLVTAGPSGDPAQMVSILVKGVDVDSFSLADVGILV